MISFTHRGDFSKTKKFLERMKEFARRGILDKYGQLGVDALYNATPKRTGKTAESWYYRIEHKNGSAIIYWGNSNSTGEGDKIALLIQYGHGTGRGNYIKGRDYINPAMQPVFDAIAEDAWEEVTNV